jgi:hypothetical protein
VNPGELSISPESGESVQPDQNGTRSRGKRGRPPGSEQTLSEEYLPPRETGGGRKG